MGRENEDWLNRLTRASKAPNPWHVRLVATPLLFLFLVVYLPFFLIVILPLLLLGGGLYTIAHPTCERLARARLERMMRSRGRLIEVDEFMRRWQGGEGTALVETDWNNSRVWWTPDRISPLAVDMLRFGLAKSREDAEKLESANAETIRIQREYVDRKTGRAMLVRGFLRRSLDLAAFPERVINLCFLAREGMTWSQFLSPVPCSCCGYDLRGLADGGVCPECGNAAVVGPPGPGIQGTKPEA